jgi:tetratricopeptide (TPR) repeat protein
MNHHMAEKSLQAGNFNKALEYDDEYAEAYFARYTFYSTRNVSKSTLLKDLNLAIKFSDEPIAFWFLERARLLSSMGNLRAASGDFMQAKNIDPSADSIWLAMADFHSIKLNQPAKALGYYDTALMINKNLYPALLGKAEMLFRLKRLREAEAALSSCIKTGKAGREVFYMRGATLIALGRNTEGCEDLNQALIMGYIEAKDLAELNCPDLF